MQGWLPSVSTIQYVLISIQSLVLTAKPYFDDEGYFLRAGNEHELAFLPYNENVCIRSSRAMISTIRKPPKV